MPDNITFRTQLLGGIAEFCQKSNLSLINNSLHLVELIVLLARYQEEGVSLSPKVYLTNDIKSLISMLPGSEIFTIGDSSFDTNGIKLALKKCAPLANGGWLIYLQDKQDKIEFGLFRELSNPISVLVDDIIMSGHPDLIVVKAFRIAHECVEIRANNGSFHYVFLNHRKEDSPPPLQYLNKLVLSIVQNTEERERESVISFLTRLLFEALRQSHGCIIAVTNMRRAPKFLSDDGILLENSIDFAKLVYEIKNNKIKPSYLDSKGYLVQGMLNSDGIILFDNNARLLGYNCFVKVNRNEDVIGGARKRAFSALSQKIGKGLCAVFMQSQDGWSDYKGKNDE